ncbi:MAG: hypothetical protein IH936_02825 [Acidobacteria bacterium]|nr:hypothetical protein [Acidobacteriota bacterium]
MKRVSFDGPRQPASLIAAAAVLAATFAAFPACAVAGDWPQFRGPTRSGASAEHMWGDKSVVIGFDGGTPWWDHRFLGVKGARKIIGADRAVLERDLNFATPLFDLEAEGHKVTLLGLQDLEGQEVIAVELERADQSKETWYLDPSSYLEVARDSPGSDFGRPMTQRTFFDNFQEVAGVMVPHYTETQWYTRHRVIDAHTIEANVEFEDALFSMPPRFGMEKLQSLAGTWNDENTLVLDNLVTETPSLSFGSTI